MKMSITEISGSRVKYGLVGLFAVLHLACVTACSVSASTINVPNFSFEAPYVGPSGAGIAIDAWDENGPDGTQGVAGNGWGGGQINLLNSDGGQIAWMNTDINTSISQVLTTTYSAGYSYKLTIGLARGYWNPPNNDDRIQIQLYYNSAGGPVVLGSATAAASQLNWSNGNYLIDYTVQLPEVLATDSCVGLQIGIRIISSFEGAAGGDGDWVIDNVRLEDTQESDPGTTQRAVITADNPYIQYSGRINFSNPLEPFLWWPGNYITAWFEGTSIYAKFNDLADDYFAVVIDDNPETVLDLGYGTGTYLLAGGLSDGVHKVVLHKRTETNINASEGAVKFLGFELDHGKGLVSPPPKPFKKIEFYGDSITAGYAVDSTSDSGAAPYKNNYLDYAARTARMLNAEYHCQAISGVGIYKSWWQYPAGDNASMYEDYYFLETATTNWDFTKWIPQVVVINLGENDKNVGGVTQAQAEGYYRDFVLALRGHYPQAHIIFALGSMSAADSAVWKGYIDNVTNLLNGPPYNDPKVYRLFFEKIHAETNRHPVASEHLIMAQHLRDFIIEKVPWFGYEHGDMDGNGRIDFNDFTRMAEDWLNSDCGFCDGGDLNADADVDIDDFVSMTENWLEDIRMEGFWRFGGDLTDSSWKARATQSSGSPAFELTGDNDGVILLDGINDFVEVYGYKGIAGGGQRTVTARIKTVAASESIVSWGANLSGGKWDFRVGSTGVLSLDAGGGSMAGSTVVSDGNWHDVAVVLEGASPDVSQARLYVDGMPESVSVLLDAPINTLAGENVKIGCWLSSNYFVGRIDEVRIYNKALNPAEISALTGE